MLLSLTVPEWFEAAIETLLDLQRIGFRVEDADIERLVREAVRIACR